MVSGREPEAIPDDNDEPSSPVSAAGLARIDRTSHCNWNYAAGDNPESTELVVTAVERDASFCGCTTTDRRQ